MGLYGDTPEPPDNGPIADAQKELGMESLQLQREQFEWSKQQGKWLQGVAQQVVDQDLQTQREQNAFASRQRDRYEDVFLPMEDEFIAEAEGFDTEARRGAEAGRAISDVGQSFDSERERASRQLARYGVDPSMLRSGALDLEMGIEEAAAKAGAGTGARRRVEDMGRALRAEAINIGKGLPSSVAGTYGTAMQAGQGASGAANQSSTTQAGMSGTPTQWGGLGASAYSGAAHTLNSGYANELAAYEANQNWGLPGLMRSGLGLASGALAGGYFNEGGVIPETMSPTGGGQQDDVTIKADVGEYVVPEEVVRWKGEEFFEKLKQKSIEARQEAIPVNRGGEGPPALPPPSHTRPPARGGQRGVLA